MARRTRSFRREPGTKKVWTSLFGVAPLAPGGTETLDLVPPQFRESGSAGLESQEATLLRIRAEVTLTPSGVPDADDGPQQWAAAGVAAIWALPTSGVNPLDSQDIADQGLIWQRLFGQGMYNDTILGSGTEPNVRRTVSYSWPELRFEIDVKAKRKFKRFRPTSDPFADLVYNITRDNQPDDGGLTVMHRISFRMLWLLR